MTFKFYWMKIMERGYQLDKGVDVLKGILVGAGSAVGLPPRWSPLRGTAFQLGSRNISGNIRPVAHVTAGLDLCDV